MISEMLGTAETGILRESRDEYFVFILRDATMFYYVYLLENQNNKSWYIGMSSDLRRRVKEHNSGQGGRTTRFQKNWKPVYFEGYRSKQDAVGREKFLKSGSGRKYLKGQLRNYLEEYD